MIKLDAELGLGLSRAVQSATASSVYTCIDIDFRLFKVSKIIGYKRAWHSITITIIFVCRLLNWIPFPKEVAVLYGVCMESNT